MLNTKQARKLVSNALEEKGTYTYYTATNKKVTAGADDATKRNLCFGIYGNTNFTQEELDSIKQRVGCKRVHTTFYQGKEYLRLIGVKFEN